ncbi:CCA tRNA nucleotidyltransferase [Hyphomicrobium sp. LHD-15]|uniref:CCA tRNA nucleotidyltransferase n=1 Tax=Hyphomicrobium sp. LHD-15 TaxID=3072142 RepID=UPI00280EDB8A|nr:CCA tRNA nucleotidyltransferase [Hyphomicrobium sp. LHD-15]MDQ8697786.1 CCA tRNA nucleotidyltransferase [Hyphomicrobium sp. LHD-15]
MSDDHDQDPPSLAGASWLTGAAVRRVLGTLAGGGFEARVVGGAVRNALLGKPVKDVDVATTAEPGDVIRLAQAAGLTAVPTGAAHGTITVIADHQPIEVTTLRRDIETFGRHARVTFTTDWTEDARRRDFTINALYCDAEGTVHDPLGGYRDLVGRRVSFIGDAQDRIREDYLRILRFFRFTADYAEGPPDPGGLEASIALAAGLEQLSAERIRAELLRLLAAKRAVAVVAVMNDAKLIENLIGVSGDVTQFDRLSAIEVALGRDPDPLLGLAALAGARPGRSLGGLGTRLRLSNTETERLQRLAFPDPAFDPDNAERAARAFLYRFGVDAFRDGVLMAWARSGAATDSSHWLERFLLPNRWRAPQLPVRGSELLDRGLAEGPAIGRVMRAFEDWWIAEDFPKDELRLAHALSDLVKANRS